MCVEIWLVQGREALQRVEGSGCDGGQRVVVERQQTDVVQAREAVVVDAADPIVAQHSRSENGEDELTERQPYITAESDQKLGSQHAQALHPSEHPAVH